MSEKLNKWKAHIIETIQEQFVVEPPRKLLKNSLYMLLGAFLLAISTEFFSVRMNLISGGTYSIGIILNALPGFDVLSVEMYILIINWLYFFIGLIFLGLKYSLKTLIVTIFYPIFVFLFDLLINNVVVNGVNILDISQATGFIINGNAVISDSSAIAISYMVAALLGGFIMGCGVGFAMVGGGSSGGTDVQAILFHKIFHVSIGTGSLISDFLIILVGFFANGTNFLACLVGVLLAVVCAKTIDNVFSSNSCYYMAFIVSKKWEELNKYIIDHIGRGTTIIKAQGGFTGVDTMLLEVCFDKHDYSDLDAIINRIDPNAFVTVMRTSEIVGYGFTRGTPEVEAKDIALSPDETNRILMKARKHQQKLKEKSEKK
ncbi:MAG: YitT family protein [Bacilli bacterium]